MARLIKANGEEVEVFPKQGELFTSEELEGFIGGYIYLYGFDIRGERFWIIANEKNESEEKQDLPYNAKASSLIGEFPEDMRQVFYGDVVKASDSEWTDNLYHQYLMKLELEEVNAQEQESSNQKHRPRLWPPLDDDFDDFVDEDVDFLDYDF